MLIILAELLWFIIAGIVGFLIGKHVFLLHVMSVTERELFRQKDMTVAEKIGWSRCQLFILEFYKRIGED